MSGLADFIATNELPAILEAETTRGLTVIPVFVAPCRVPEELAGFQGINSSDRTLEDSTKADADRILVKLVDLIRERGSRG